MNRLPGTWRLARLALRRDRIQLPTWLAGLTLLTVTEASSVAGLYPTDADRIKLAVSTANSAVSLIFNGIVSGSSLGATAMNQVFMPGAVAAAIMSAMLVVRHTRQNEETGRAELVGAAVVGRYASLASALLVAVAANVVLAALNLLVLAANGLSFSSSLLAACSMSGVGIVFAAVATVTAQVAGSSRGANGLALVVLAAVFVLRALGDIAGHVTRAGTNVVSGWLSWLSPLGWAQQARPFDADNWWVLAPILGLAGALIAAAAMLNAHRDVGTGMLSERAGPASAACGLLRPLGLAWRLQRGTLLAWATGMAVIGAALGGVGNELDSLIGDSDRSRHLIENLGGGGTQLADAYSAAMFGMLGIAVAGYAVSALLRMRSEETGGCLELLLSTSVRRTRWLLGHVAVVMFGALVLLTCAGLGFAVSYGIVTDDLTGRLGELLLAALIQLPAVLPVVGCAALAFGVLPRLVIGISWTVFTGCFAITELGDALDLPRGVVQLSPFSHVPAAPADDVSVLPLVVLTAIAVALVGLGGAGLRHRDLTA